jgi:hypothetical protein
MSSNVGNKAQYENEVADILFGIKPAKKDITPL